MVDSSEPNENNIKKANALKEEGNECVKASKFNDAIEKYTEAIKLNRDPVYFCNRAAAYCRIEKFDLAIEDCRSALELDENYAKAYGRMGLAYLSQDRNEDAVEAYKKALELDPTGESYKTNLEIAQEKIREANRRSQSNPGANPFGGLGGLGNLFGGGAGGMPNLSALMNDPQMMQATMEMMNDPNMQNLMGSMMEQFMGGSAGGAGGGGFEDLIAAGQNMAQQMQQSNPELVEQLRQQFASGSPPPMTDPNLQNLVAPMMEQFMGGASGGDFDAVLAAGQNMAQQMRETNPQLIEQLRQRFAGTLSAADGNQHIPSNAEDGFESNDSGSDEKSEEH